MSTTQFASRRTVDAFSRRWRDRVARRIRARDEHRPPWDRQQFLTELLEDHPWYPGAVELADKFQQAYDRAHGSPARFELELDLLNP